MKRFRQLFITFVLLLPQITMAENMQLEVIPLQKRMVEDVIQIIRPLVTPNGDQVTLLSATELSSIKPGDHAASNVQDLETTVTGRLGEWMELGGIDQSFSRGRHQNFSSSNVHRQELHTMLIKVDEIK